MNAKSFDHVLAQAETLVRVWTDNPTFSLGEVSLASVQAMIDAHKATRAGTASLRTQLTKGVSDCSSQRDALSDIVSRGRSGMRAQFGVDSTQYQQVGGTRLVDRKPPRRKPAPTVSK